MTSTVTAINPALSVSPVARARQDTAGRDNRPWATAGENSQLVPGGSESGALHGCRRLQQTAEEAESSRRLGPLLTRHAPTQACTAQAMLTHAHAKEVTASTEPRRQAGWREAALVVEESWQARRARRRRVARRAPPPRLLQHPSHLPPRPLLPNPHPLHHTPPPHLPGGVRAVRLASGDAGRRESGWRGS